MSEPIPSPTGSAKGTPPCRQQDEEPADNGGLGVPVLRWSLKGSAIPLFSTGLRALWVVCLLITLVAELIPMPLISPLPFYSLKAFKGLSFLCFGFATPLAFWRFDSLGYGILLALVMTIIVEASQAPIMGHSFSWLEMGAKVVFVFFGFMFGLNARYDRQISLGPWRVSLLPGASVAHQKASKAGR